MVLRPLSPQLKREANPQFSEFKRFACDIRPVKRRNSKTEGPLFSGSSCVRLGASLLGVRKRVKERERAGEREAFSGPDIAACK